MNRLQFWLPSALTTAPYAMLLKQFTLQINLQLFSFLFIQIFGLSMSGLSHPLFSCVGSSLFHVSLGCWMLVPCSLLVAVLFFPLSTSHSWWVLFVLCWFPVLLSFWHWLMVSGRSLFSSLLIVYISFLVGSICVLFQRVWIHCFSLLAPPWFLVLFSFLSIQVRVLSMSGGFVFHALFLFLFSFLYWLLILYSFPFLKSVMLTTELSHCTTQYISLLYG